MRKGNYWIPEIFYGKTLRSLLPNKKGKKMMNDKFKILGLKVKDKVSGFSGIVTSLSFDLYGCIQVLIHPGIDGSGKLGDQMWFDYSRCEIIDQHPVMEHPFETSNAIVSCK